MFAINFFFYDIRESYISAFIAPLIFSAAMFIPKNAVALDASRITRTLTALFTIGAVFYVIEAIVKARNLVPNLGDLDEVQIHKSLTCVLAICLCILTRRPALLLFNLAVVFMALALRPVSTLVLALICCVPLAIALRIRVSRLSSIAVLMGQSIAVIVLLVALSVPVLLYFYFDDIAPIITSWESFLRATYRRTVNVAFRLAILKIAFVVNSEQNSFGMAAR